MRSVFILICLCAVGCAARDEAFYLRRGGEIQSQLIVELEGVESLHDLFSRQEAFSSLFDELARTAIEARRYQMREKTSWGIPQDLSEKSRGLEEQMQRVLKIAGARAFLERCQSKGFDRLDAFEKGAPHSCSKGMR